MKEYKRENISNIMDSENVTGCLQDVYRFAFPGK